MTQAGAAPFTTTLDKTNHVLREIEEAYGWPRDRRNQSYAALRAVLHAVRDRLTVTEAADLAAQLPMLIRGLYYEGWKPTRVPVKLDKEEFLARVRGEFPYTVEGGMEQLVQRVLAALRSYVSDGEWNDVRSSLPQDVAALFTV
jgi:uncharacterized protein (DUF2267 family)